jgi:hypothetical protein
MGTDVDGGGGVDSRGNFALGSATLPSGGAEPGTRAVKGARRRYRRTHVEWEEV